MSLFPWDWTTLVSMLDGAPNFLKLLWCHLYLMCILLHGLVTAIYTPTSLSIFPYIYRCDFPIMLRWTALIQSVNYELLPTKLPMSRTIYLLTNQVICNRIIIYYHHFVEKSYNSLSLSLSLSLSHLAWTTLITMVDIWFIITFENYFNVAYFYYLHFYTR